MFKILVIKIGVSSNGMGTVIHIQNIFLATLFNIDSFQ
jgi:hypothetical protein